MSKRTISLIVLALAFALILYAAPDVLLIVFAGILFGVFLGGSGDWIATKLGISQGFGIAIFLVGILMAFTALGFIAAPELVRQFDALVEEVPAAFESGRERLAEYEWGSDLIDSIQPEGLFSSGSGMASSAVTATFGALGNFVIILFIGLYGALDPELYRRGFRLLLAPSLRQRGEAVMSKSAQMLRNWLVAQLMAMTVVGVLTAIGLWLVGIPLAFILGTISGLLAFIPNIGPILAAAPGILIGLAEGPTTALWVAAVYVGVQALESHAITPLIQQEKVSLPPALIIASQLLMGVLFGLLGLALAMPLAALLMTLIGMLYVNDYLERENSAGAPR